MLAVITYCDFEGGPSIFEGTPEIESWFTIALTVQVLIFIAHFVILERKSSDLLTLKFTGWNAVVGGCVLAVGVFTRIYSGSLGDPLGGPQLAMGLILFGFLSFAISGVLWYITKYPDEEGFGTCC